MVHAGFGATFFAAACVALLAGGAVAQTPDPEPGRRLARDFCSACHQVEPDTALASPNPDAPSFALIAATSSLTDLAIRVFLRSPHAKMPNFLLSEDEIASVIAYLRTFPRQ